MGYDVVKRSLTGLLLAALVVVPSCPVAGADWDLRSESWVATDARGRTLPGYEECGPPRENRTVGMFYFLWLGQHGTGGPYDITRLLAADPSNPAWGPVNAFHHWGEPELGYYLSSEEYVIRRHCQMLVDAGVDVIIFDVTNAHTYTSNYMKLLGIYSQMRANGERTPQVSFFGNSGYANVVQTLYSDLYSKNLYSDLWFRWKGKPLMLTKPDGLPPEIQSFFTFRYTWAWCAGQDSWTFIDSYPQGIAWHEQGVPEQLSVAVAGHPTTNRGRSLVGGVQPVPDARDNLPTSGDGLSFAEQWSRAFDVDPEFVFVTGWNEWVAQRFLSDGNAQLCGRQLPAGASFFVDAYTQEYSRDIEPMKGGHTDNYYYQLIANVRRFKGVRPREVPSPPKPVAIDGQFADWDSVAPEFRDSTGDTILRHSAGWGSAGILRNYTGRNDILKLKVTYDADNVYFYAETRTALTPHTGPNWMLLFIDCDHNPATGWHGYDYLANYGGLTPSATTLRRNTGGWNWELVGEAPLRFAGSKLEMSIPRESIGKAGTPAVELDFHWADNIQKPDDIIQFAVSGDSAPNRRANYRFAKPLPCPSWEFDADADTRGWSAAHSVADLTTGAGTLTGRISGADPYIVGPSLPVIDAGTARYVLIRMKVSGGSAADLFWATPSDPAHKAERRVSFPVIADARFHEYVVDMSANPDWTGKVIRLRLDPSNWFAGQFAVDYIRVVDTPGYDLGSITGMVKDDRGNALSGAVVTTHVGSHAATTPSDGTFALPGLESGIYNLTVTCPGYRDRTIPNISVSPRHACDVTVSLEPLPDGGTAAALRASVDGEQVRLSGKAMFYRSGTVGYIEEPDRSSGIRIEGGIDTSSGTLVNVSGRMRTSGSGERYIQLDHIESDGNLSVRPLGLNLRAAASRLVDGLCVRVWGIVKEGSVTAASFVLTDGSQGPGIRVITAGPPGVQEGSFVAVVGAAGFDGGRLIHSMSVTG